jgi:hypothetical protein
MALTQEVGSMKYVLAALGLLAGSLPAHSQSINVDFEPAASPYGTPSPYYGGSAQAQGFWNSIHSTSVSSLRRWDGAPTGVSLTFNDSSVGCGTSPDSFAWTVDASTTGEDELLLDDRYNPSASGGVTCRFEGLLPGDYVVDTIVSNRSCLPGSGRVLVTVLGSPDPQEEVFASWSGSFVEGQNFARHAVTVTNGTLTIEFEMRFFIEYIEIAGIQLDHGDRTPLPGVPFCFGDGTAGAACPCSNAGREGRGCENSIGTGGALLFAAGTTSPDTLVLRASGERPTSLSVFLQGDTNILPVPYGDGLRCTGGTLRRLYARNASGGEASAPLPGEPSITQRSAQLGVPIAPGETRIYQVYYRDGAAGFCPPPQGSSFNSTGALGIVW